MSILVIGLLPVQQREFDRRFPDDAVTHISSQQQHRMDGGQYDAVVLCTAFISHHHTTRHRRQSARIIYAPTRGISGIARDVRAALSLATV